VNLESEFAFPNIFATYYLYRVPKNKFKIKIVVFQTQFSVYKLAKTAVRILR